MTPFEEFLHDECSDTIRHFGEDVADDETIVVFDDHTQFMRNLADEIPDCVFTKAGYQEILHVPAEHHAWLVEFFGAETFARVSDQTLNGDETHYELRLDDVVRLMGADDYGHSDSWDVCDDCNKLVFTQPTSYCDAGRFIYIGGSLICHHCVTKDPRRYLDEYLEAVDTGDAHGRFPLDGNELGFFAVSDRDGPIKFQNGLHHGMNDDFRKLHKMAKAVCEEFNRERDDLDDVEGDTSPCVVLAETEPSQFYAEMTLWFSHEEGAERMARKLAQDRSYKIYPTPAQRAESALRGISKQMNQERS